MFVLYIAYNDLRQSLISSFTEQIRYEAQHGAETGMVVDILMNRQRLQVGIQGFCNRPLLYIRLSDATQGATLPGKKGLPLLYQE